MKRVVVVGAGASGLIASIFASYNNEDKLVKAELFVSSFAEVATTLYNVTEGKVKIFLWEENLTPIEITTIPTEIK